MSRFDMSHVHYTYTLYVCNISILRSMYFYQIVLRVNHGTDEVLRIAYYVAVLKEQVVFETDSQFLERIT